MVTLSTITDDNYYLVIKALRDYYRKNFVNGESNESFLFWLE